MLSAYLEQFVTVQLSGGIEITGVLKEEGPDIIIISECEVYRYIPIRHIQQITFPDCQIEALEFRTSNRKTSFRKSLMNAKGRNVNILLGKNTRLYGYIMSIMNNYFVFFSPIYKTVFISMDHVKSVTFDEVDPYGQDKNGYQPSTLTLTRTFEEQLEKLIGQIVVFNLGDVSQKIGKLFFVEEGLSGLISAHGDEHFLNIRHIRSFHVQ